jgi:hypothetical protein
VLTESEREQLVALTMRRKTAVGAGANVLSFGRFENADGFAAAFA